MPGNNLLIGGACILVLVLLAARAALRLDRDRRRGNGGQGGDDADIGADAAVRAAAMTRRRRHQSSEAAHLAMAVGMALMFLPLPFVRLPLAGLFSLIVLAAATVWVTDRVRSARTGQRRVGQQRAADCGCSPEHRLEPHHVIVGSAMVVMALRSHSAATSATAAAGMATMPGMAMGAGGSPSLVSLTLLGYVWLSVLVLGGGLARTFRAEPGLDPGLGAMLGAPTTVYACELAMTVVMGLMLLA